MQMRRIRNTQLCAGPQSYQQVRTVPGSLRSQRVLPIDLANVSEVFVLSEHADECINGCRASKRAEYRMGRHDEVVRCQIINRPSA
jgi:hypothetical protein